MRKLLFISFVLWSSSAQGNIIGSDFQNFNPGMSIHDYVTVHSAKPLKQGQFSLGLHVNHAVNTLPYFDSVDGTEVDTIRDYSNGITAGDLNIAIGVLKNLDLTLAIPYIIDQDVRRSTEFYGSFSRLGNTELRGGFKWSAIPTDFFGLAFVGTVNYNRIENNPYAGNEEWPAFSLETVGELDFGIVRTAANVGYRWRKPGDTIPFDDETPIEPFEDQWIYSAAVDVTIPTTDLHVMVESYGSYTEKDNSTLSARNASIIEGNLALRYQPYENFFAQIGVGREMRHAVSSADERYFAGLVWAVGPFVRNNPPPRVVAQPLVKKATPRKVRVIDLDDVLFNFDSDVVREDIEADKLRNLRAALSDRDAVSKIIIEGHACAIGSERYNLDLSERRADALVDWVVENFGFPREKVIPVGFGEQVPYKSNVAESNRRRNRRVRFSISY